MAQQGVMENTFRFPTDTVPVSKVKNETDAILHSKFGDVPYEPRSTALLLKEATDEIAKSLKKTIPQRFKFAVQCNLCEKIGQAIFSGSMCLWDAEHDNYITTTYETPTFIAIVVIFCSLLE